MDRLERLESEERALSARRRRLQDRIDFIRSGRAPEGLDAGELERLLDEERELSRRRAELHGQIDAIRLERGMVPGPTERPRLLGS